MTITVPSDALLHQLTDIFASWGMREEHVATIVELMVESDLRGIDSHGVGKLQQYERQWREGKINVDPDVRVVSDWPTLGMVDADHGLGHVPSRMAMQAAIEKCAAMGVGAMVVRNSNHFGAAGVYSTMALPHGFIGVAMAAATQGAVVPTFGRDPVFGTSPLAFAAPAGEQPPFSLDIATSTVAVGKISIARREGKPMPVGWATDAEGRPETDAARAEANKPLRLSPLGGTRELGSHKGYGLAVMVNILGAVLGGSYFTSRDLKTGKTGQYLNAGHFFMAIDPMFFLDEAGAFEASMDGLIARVRACPPMDPDQSVLIPGDPERDAYAERIAHGIPMTEALFGEIRQVAESSGVPFLLAEAAR